MITPDSLSDDEFDYLADLALDITSTQYQFLDQNEDNQTTAHMVKSLLDSDLYDINIQMDLPHQAWWDDDLKEIFDANEENEEKEDNYTDILELSVVATHTKKADESVVVSALLFKFDPTQPIIGGTSHNVTLQWLPERNSL